MKYKILVTGGCGFLGSVLVLRLLELGHEVDVVDNFRYRQIVDLRPANIVKCPSGKYDFIFPLACITGAPACDKFPEEARQVIIYELNGLIANYPNTPIIYPTTNSGYGIGEDYKVCDESSPLRPVSLYGKLKVEAEKIVLDRGGVTLRLATVFGVSPCMRSDLLVNFLVWKAFLGETVELYESHFTRNYVHIQDVVNAFVWCMSHFEEMSGQAYNFGLSSANLSKRELCLEIKRLFPNFKFKEVSGHKDPDQRNYIVSNEKAKRMGLEAKIPLEQGIRELLAFYTRHTFYQP